MFDNPDEFVIVAGRYLVDKHTGYVITVRDFEEMKKNANSKKQSIGGVSIPVEAVKDLIKNGYIQNWDQIYAKWQKRDLGRNVVSEYKIENGDIKIIKEEPKKEEFKTEGTKHSYEDGYYSWVNPKVQKQEGTKYSDEDGFYSWTEPKEDPDLDIEDWINRRKEKEDMRYEGTHVAGNMNQETAQRAREEARRYSHTERKHAAERNREQQDEMPKKKKINLKEIIISIMLVATISGATLGIEKGIDSAVTAYHTNRQETQIATLLVPKGAKNIPTIVERNTHDTDDFQQFWYDNAGMAEEILEIPDEMFDAALYSVYHGMGEYRSTAYCDNFDTVIADIASIFNINDAEVLTALIKEHPNAYARCAGCASFKEYLSKNGYVDENGLPDEKAFVEAMKDLVNSQYANIKAAADYHHETGENGEDWVEAAQEAYEKAQENEGGSRK